MRTEPYRIRAEWAAHARGLCALAWSPDGRYLASAGNEGAIRVWDVTSSGVAEHAHAAAHDGSIRALAWSPDGSRLASGGEDGFVRGWDRDLARPPRVYHRYERWVNTVAWSPDGELLASAGGDGVLVVERARDGTPVRALGSPYGTYMTAQWAPDRPLFAASSRCDTVVVRRSGDWAPYRRLEATFGTVWSVEWVPGANLLCTGGDDGLLTVWDVDAGRPQAVIEAHAGTVARVTCAAGGRLAASLSHDRTVAVWDLAGPELVARVEDAYPGWVGCLSFHPRLPVLATTDTTGATIRLLAFDAFGGFDRPAPAATGVRRYADPNAERVRSIVAALRAEGHDAVATADVRARLGAAEPGAREVVRLALARADVVAIDNGEQVVVRPERVRAAASRLEASVRGAPVSVRAVTPAVAELVLRDGWGWLDAGPDGGALHVPDLRAEAPADGAPPPWRVWQVRAGRRDVARVLAALVDTTLFRRVGVRANALELEDANGGVVLARVTATASERYELALHRSAPAPPYADAVAALVERFLDRLGAGHDVLDVPRGALAAPPVRRTGAAQLWDPDGARTWALAPGDLPADPGTAAALLHEHVDDERARQRRLVTYRERTARGTYDVLLCHLPDALADARALAAELARVGIGAWVDARARLLEPHELGALADRAEACGVVAFAIDAVAALPWERHPLRPFYDVLAERRAAGGRRLRWLPVRLGSAPGDPQLPDFLHSFDWFRWRPEPRSQRREDLIALVGGIVVDRARS